MDSRATDAERLVDDAKRISRTWQAATLPAQDRADAVREFGRLLAALHQVGWNGLLGWRDELPDEYLPEWYLARRAERLDTLERDLGRFAEGWGRSKDHPSQREMFYEAYVNTLEELFRIGHWSGEPAAESQLPDELMPKVYREFWEVKQGVWTL
jgi:hypothetical protein